MTKRIISTFITLCAVSLGDVVSAQDVAKQADKAAEKSPKLEDGLKIKPVILDAKGGSGTVLGIDYSYKKKVFSGGACLGSSNAEQDEINPNAPRCERGYQFDAAGTIVSSAEKNPNKMLDFSGSYRYRIKHRALMQSYGAQAKYETDQTFENKQFVAGGTATATYIFGVPESDRASKEPQFLDNSVAALDFGIARVNPATDKARKTALAGGPLDSYQRWEVEGYFNYLPPGDWKFVKTVEFNYRHFQELNPPAAIKQAGLQRHRLGIIRINLPEKFFVQYSRGSLPFDTKSDRVVKFGLEYKIF